MVSQMRYSLANTIPHIIKIPPKKRTCVVLLCILQISVSTVIPAGMFKMACHDRHFWLNVQSQFLGQTTRLGFEDSSGVHYLPIERAAECGYGIGYSAAGDLVVRASFLACHVNSKLGQKGAEFWLRVHVVNEDADSREVVYPLLLSCPLFQAWNPREVVCEEGYMEVSVTWWLPHNNHLNREEDVRPPEEDGLSQGQVAFHVPHQTSVEAMSVRQAHLQGYRINAMGDRLVMRCLYSSPLSYVLQVPDHGIEVEAVSATVFYQRQKIPLLANLSVACPLSRAMVDGEHLSWTFPQILSPLVQGWFRDKGVRMGVGASLLSECQILERGYEIGLRHHLVEIRIPFGAEGGFIKSNIVDHSYSQSFSVDLFFIHQWEEGHWGVTQHRSFRSLNTTYVPRRLVLINNTIPGQGMFSVTFGVFSPEVSLRSVAVRGEAPLSWAQARKSGLRVSLMPFANGSHAYQIQVPFTHPQVFLEYIGGGYRRHILEMVLSLDILPSNVAFFHHATVVCDSQDAVLPRLEGKCTDKGVLVLLHYGNLGSKWEMYIDGRRMDWEVVKLGGYVVNLEEEEYFSVELSMYSLGVVYENISLQGLKIRVEASVVNVDSEIVEHTLVQQCTFPVWEFLLCLPEGRAVAVVDTSRTTPPVKPNRTALLDLSCRPSAADGTRALFNFSLDSCGTKTSMEGNHLVYENEVVYMERTARPLPLIHRDTHFRLILQCRYLVNSSITIHHLPTAFPSSTSNHTHGSPGYLWSKKPPSGRAQRSVLQQRMADGSVKMSLPMVLIVGMVSIFLGILATVIWLKASCLFNS
ncbi:zona pellucida protein AX 4 isoform X3 [Brienomyrus brachyistius]|uniref:zona pellucida protein AX 4 isoform X3 n=1 Tax=Brienomyrus brachyistius TaxID=42636 RepID=UPI0020B4088E|nr:zona pellucida protein AX 4 isoform X3 [Brienomyrus brachyistius]